MGENQGNLCKTCKYRFRRVFIPTRSEEYEGDEGNSMVIKEDTIVISNQCLIMDMDIDGETTIECSHFEPIEKHKEVEFPLLKHLR